MMYATTMIRVFSATRCRPVLGALFVVCLGQIWSDMACGGQPYVLRERVYSALDAGLDAYQFHDAIRREQIAHQIDLNLQLRHDSYPRFFDPLGDDPFDLEASNDCDNVRKAPEEVLPPAPSATAQPQALRFVPGQRGRMIQFRTPQNPEELPLPAASRPNSRKSPQKKLPRDLGPREF